MMRKLFICAPTTMSQKAKKLILIICRKVCLALAHLYLIFAA